MPRNLYDAHSGFKKGAILLENPDLTCPEYPRVKDSIGVFINEIDNIHNKIFIIPIKMRL